MNKQTEQNDEIGFSVSCYKGDLPYLRGCLESIKRFAPDAPVCLIADGQFSTDFFERNYGVTVIRKDDVHDQRLREKSFGFGVTKMIAFWEAPFGIVYHLDADTVLWGDPRENLPSPLPDVVFNEPHEVITEFIQKNQYFDPEKIFSVIEPFDWKERPYFNAGTLVVRRGTLSLDKYLELLDLRTKHPDLLINGDQGLLNILIFSSVDQGLITAQEAHQQTIVTIKPVEELREEFQFDAGEPVVSKRPTVIHWPGLKPVPSNAAVFSEPMNYFRRKSFERENPYLLPIGLALRFDLFRATSLRKFGLRMKSFVKKLLGR